MDDDDFDENGLDSEGRTAEERREYFRVRERVLLKHRNTSRWAKRAIKKGIAHLPGTREAMAEQHRLAQQLKQKVNAPEMILLMRMVRIGTQRVNSNRALKKKKKIQSKGANAPSKKRWTLCIKPTAATRIYRKDCRKVFLRYCL